MAERLVERTRQFVEVVGASIGQRMVGLIPDALIRVEFRSVGREALQAEPRETTTEFADGFAFVGFAIVPYHDHTAAQMTQYVA